MISAGNSINEDILYSRQQVWKMNFIHFFILPLAMYYCPDDPSWRWLRANSSRITYKPAKLTIFIGEHHMDEIHLDKYPCGPLIWRIWRWSIGVRLMSSIDRQQFAAIRLVCASDVLNPYAPSLKIPSRSRWCPGETPQPSQYTLKYVVDTGYIGTISYQRI